MDRSQQTRFPRVVLPNQNRPPSKNDVDRTEAPEIPDTHFMDCDSSFGQSPLLCLGLPPVTRRFRSLDLLETLCSDPDGRPGSIGCQHPRPIHLDHLVMVSQDVPLEVPARRPGGGSSWLSDNTENARKARDTTNQTIAEASRPQSQNRLYGGCGSLMRARERLCKPSPKTITATPNRDMAVFPRNKPTMNGMNPSTRITRTEGRNPVRLLSKRSKSDKRNQSTQGLRD